MERLVQIIGVSNGSIVSYKCGNCGKKTLKCCGEIKYSFKILFTLMCVKNHKIMQVLLLDETANALIGCSAKTYFQLFTDMEIKIANHFASQFCLVSCKEKRSPNADFIVKSIQFLSPTFTPLLVRKSTDFS